MSAFWDERYQGQDFVYGRQPNDFVREQAGRIPKGPVLCLASGEGRNAVYLAGLGHEVTAVDLSQQGLQKTQRLAQEAGLTLHTRHEDLSTIELEPEHYTGILAIFAHLPPPARARMHAQAVRALRPGGVLILEAYRPEQLALGTGGPRNEAMLMRLDALKQELAGLNLEIAREVHRDIQEGVGHSGPSETVQILAVKP